MKKISFLNCILLLYFFTHVTVDHGRHYTHSETHEHSHLIDDHHDSSHLHVFHEDDDHHTDHEHFHPQYIRSFQRKLPTIEGINLIDVNSVISFVFPAKETKQIVFQHSDLPPPRIVPIYINICSFLL